MLNRAIHFAKGKTENVIVLSIPDYTFTSLGQKSGKAKKITLELNSYNAFAEKLASEKGAKFVNITPIPQKELINTILVAINGLHLSTEAYKKFVEMVFESALKRVR